MQLAYIVSPCLHQRAAGLTRLDQLPAVALDRRRPVRLLAAGAEAARHPKPRVYGVLFVEPRDWGLSAGFCSCVCHFECKPPTPCRVRWIRTALCPVSMPRRKRLPPAFAAFSTVGIGAPWPWTRLTFFFRAILHSIAPHRNSARAVTASSSTASCGGAQTESMTNRPNRQCFSRAKG